MIQLQLENTSTCNAKCSFCPYPTAGRWGGQMTMGLFQKIMDEAGELDTISQICITGLGEPLLDRFLVDRVKYARAKKPTAFIDVFTNGVYLNAQKFDAIRDAGASSVQVSLNAVRGEQHERIMGLKDKFDIVCSHIDYAIVNRKKMGVEVRAVIDYENFTEEDGLAFNARWGLRGEGGHGALIREGNWAGDNRTTRFFDPSEACIRALSQIYITYDGKVTTCCFDPTGNQVFGDLNQQTLRDVYASDKYLAFREAHFMNQADRYSICKDCTRI